MYSANLFRIAQLILQANSLQPLDLIEVSLPVDAPASTYSVPGKHNFALHEAVILQQLKNKNLLIYVLSGPLIHQAEKQIQTIDPTKRRPEKIGEMSLEQFEHELPMSVLKLIGYTRKNFDPKKQIEVILQKLGYVKATAQFPPSDAPYFILKEIKHLDPDIWLDDILTEVKLPTMIQITPDQTLDGITYFTGQYIPLINFEDTHSPDEPDYLEKKNEAQAQLFNLFQRANNEISKLYPENKYPPILFSKFKVKADPSMFVIKFNEGNL